MLISSASNERIKHARRVRDGREEGLIFIEGQRLAEECQRSGLRIESCFHTPDPSERTEALVQELSSQGVAVYPTHPSVLSSLSATVTTQGVILIAHRPTHAIASMADAVDPLIVGLDRVQDPGNVGTLIRTAEAAGATGIVLLAGCADPYSPKALRSAMGSAFRLPIMESVTMDDVRKLKLSHVAATGSGEITHYDYDWRQPTLLWLGNEGSGLDDALMADADVRLRIPLQAGVESLNVAAAGAAMLFEAARQRLA